MSTQTTTTLRERVDDLNRMILEGKILEAFDTYYAPDVVMEERDNRREGFEANRAFEESFVNNLTAFRGAEIRAVGVDEKNGVAMVEWFFDYSHKEWGDMKYTQVARQVWKDGKVVHERFYHTN